MEYIVRVIFYTIVILGLNFIHMDLNRIEKAIKEKEQDKIETVTNVEAEYVFIGNEKWDVKSKGVKK